MTPAPRRCVVALALAGWGVMAGSARAQVSTTDLQAYWKLDAAGITADAHGSNTLTNNGTTTTTTGKINEAGSFNGSSQYLSIADNAALSMGDIDFSFSFWIYRPSSSSFPVVFSKDGSSAAVNEYLLYDNTGGGDFAFAVYDSSNNATVVISGSSTSTNAWHFVACGHSATNNEAWISVNGATPVTAAHAAGVRDGSNPFQVGAASARSLFWLGRIDEFAVWKRDIRSDLGSLYNSGAGLPYSSFGGGGGSSLPYPQIIISQLAPRLLRQQSHFDTYGVYALAL